MKELIYPHMFLPAVEQYGGAVGIIDGDYRGSWYEHADRVSRLAHGLAHPLGVTAADRFAVLARNGHAYLELWHAAFMGAGIINPLNLRLAPRELAYILRDSGTELPADAPLDSEAAADAALEYGMKRLSERLAAWGSESAAG